MRRLFDRFRALVRRCGPVTVYPQKTRIVFQVRVRFAGITPRKRWLDGAVWLTRRVESPVVRRIETIMPRVHIHHFRLVRLLDVDRQVAALVREAYAIGCQKHLEPTPVEIRRGRKTSR